MPAGAPTGNHNAAKGKQWRNALERALAHEHGSVNEGLLAIAAVVVKAAGSGDREAWIEIGNRMDGKVPQAHVGDEESPAIQHSLTVSYK